MLKNRFFTSYKILLLLILVLALFSFNTKSYSEITLAQIEKSPRFKLEYRTKSSALLDEVAIKEIEKSFDKLRPSTRNNKMTAVGILRSGSNWEILSMTSLDMDDISSYSFSDDETLPKFDEFNTFNVLYIKKDGKVLAATDTDANIEKFVNLIPDTELDIKSKKMFLHKIVEKEKIPSLNTLSSNTWKLPWQVGENWRMGPKRAPCYWHDGFGANCFGKGIDFFSPNSPANTKVIAPVDGGITHVCMDPDDDNYLMRFTKQGTSETMMMTHIAEDSVPPGLTFVTQGTFLGNITTDVNFSPNFDCGTSSKPHLHIDFMTKPQSIDGYYFANPIGSNDTNKPSNDINVIDYKTSIYSTNILLSEGCAPPSNGDWIITKEDCLISNTITFDRSIIVKNGAVLTIKSTGILDLDLQSKKINVENGGKLLIENGGKIH